MSRRAVSMCLLALVAALALPSRARAAEAGRGAGGAGDLKLLVPGVLQVCLYPGFAPFSSKDAQGQWVGWDISYLQDFAKREKLIFRPVEVPSFDGIWNLPAQGKCDVAGTGISDTPDRRKQTGDAAIWSQHYYRVVRSYAVRLVDQGKLNSVQDLQNKTVIVTGGSTADDDLRNRLKQAGITSVTVQTTDDERAAALQVRDGKGVPFAYGGGLGSIQLLVQELGGLAIAWEHCNMLADGTQADEPFSFVTRAQSATLASHLDQYIKDPSVTYPGGPGPDLKCPPAGE